LIAAVVLAAGASSRYGIAPPKQQELLPRVLAALRGSSSLDRILVVAGAHEIETDADVVRCRDWELGPGASLLSLKHN
jgi:CTP:molybdopterin cytidylyltransferase MocA